MPVIGINDYLNFQRNLIAESNTILNRATAIENRVSSERQQQQAMAMQQKNQSANMAMALKRLSFEERAQAAREKYNNKTLKLQRERLTMQKSLNDENLKLQAVKLQTAEFERDALKMQLDSAKARGQNVAGIMQKYQGLLAARKPGEDGSTDADTINKAALDLMSSAMADPQAAEEFSRGLGVAGITGLLPEDMAPLSTRKIMAEVEAKRASLLPEAPKTTDEVAKVTWLEKQSDQFVQRHANMTVAGYGTFSGVKQVRDAKDSFYETNWRDAGLVTQEINTIRAAGLLSNIDINNLLLKEAVMSPEGDGGFERSQQKVANMDVANEEARAATMNALKRLRGVRASVVARASGFDLIEGMMARRETQVRSVLNDVWSDKKDQPGWATVINTEASAVLKEGDEQWNNVLNDPDLMAATANYRADPNPNSDTWTATASTINARLSQLGLDKSTRRYIVEMIKATHPAYHLIK